MKYNTRTRRTSSISNKSRRKTHLLQRSLKRIKTNRVLRKVQKQSRARTPGRVCHYSKRAGGTSVQYFIAGLLKKRGKKNPLNIFLVGKDNDHSFTMKIVRTTLRDFVDLVYKHNVEDFSMKQVGGSVSTYGSVAMNSDTLTTMKPEYAAAGAYEDKQTAETKGPPAAVPEAQSASEPEAPSAAEPEGQPEVEHEATPAAVPKATPEVEPEGQPEVEHEATPAAVPKATPEVEPEGQPEVEHEATPAAVPKATPEVEPEGQPAVEPEGTPAVEPEGPPATESEGPAVPASFSPPKAESKDEQTTVPEGSLTDDSDGTPAVEPEDVLESATEGVPAPANADVPTAEPEISKPALGNYPVGHETEPIVIESNQAETINEQTNLRNEPQTEVSGVPNLSKLPSVAEPITKVYSSEVNKHSTIEATPLPRRTLKNKAKDKNRPIAILKTFKLCLYSLIIYNNQIMHDFVEDLPEQEEIPIDLSDFARQKLYKKLDNSNLIDKVDNVKLFISSFDGPPKDYAELIEAYNYLKNTCKRKQHSTLKK